MKNTIQLLKNTFLLIIFCFVTTVQAQVPQKMNYQAVLRNANNNLIINTTVGIKISILSNSNTIAYSESHTATTNENGLVTLEIGGGTPLLGTFASINWASGTYSVKTETDPTGGTNYSITGTSQLLSVPYALYAANNGGGSNSPQWATNGNNISNSNSGNVSIGTTIPQSKLTVKSTNRSVASFDGPDQTYITIAENGIQRGYVGSYSGNPEDIDLGTYGGNTTGAVHLATNGTPNLSVISNGNVGIGTTTPTSKLDVNGNVAINGNVGIGTTTPTSTLNVNGQLTIDQKNFGGYGGLLIKGDGPGNNYPNIAMTVKNTDNEDVVAGYIGGTITDNSTGNEAMDLAFLTSEYGLDGLSEKMTIKSNGNVGIGTTTPTSKLNVNGQLTIDQKNFGGYGGLLIKGDGPGSNYPNIAMTVKNTNNQDVVAGYIGGRITDKTAGNEAMDLSFLTSQSGLSGLSEKMTIKSNGAIAVNGNTGTAGQMLTSQGNDNPPIWIKPIDDSTITINNLVERTIIASNITNVFNDLFQIVNVPSGQKANLYYSASFEVKGNGCSGLFCSAKGICSVFLDNQFLTRELVDLSVDKYTKVTFANVGAAVGAGTHAFRIVLTNDASVNNWNIRPQTATVLAIAK
jgi:hypothetical protein